MKIKFFALLAALAVVIVAVGGLIASAIHPDGTPDTNDSTIEDNATIIDVETEAPPVAIVFYDDTAAEVIGCAPEPSGFWLLEDGEYVVNLHDGSSMNLLVDNGSWSWAS